MGRLKIGTAARTWAAAQWTLGAILFSCLLFSGVAARADTYDTHTLVAITTSGPQDVQLLYSSRVDIVGRNGDLYKALLTADQMKDLTARGLHIVVLYDEMAEDRRLWAEADAAAEIRAPSYYYLPSKFNTTNPATNTLMKHLLDLHTAHPDITRLYDIGNSYSGSYDILAIKVTKNPDVVEAEPKIRIYGNIHGDEKSGLMVACEALDWILTNYPTDASARKLVDESEMWFIPMGNPDGNASNNRYNGNGVDLNRNFWGPAGNSDGTGPFSEPETQAIRDLTETATADHSKKRFTTSLSFHAGAICFNSVWNYTTTLTTDEPIFFTNWTGGPQGEALPAPNGLARAYQDGCTTSGFWYTNGANWYITNGDTNDWSYGIWGDLDTTLEVTTTKTPAASTIPTFVTEHRQATINYMLKTFQGIHGVMTDGDTGAPLDGTVLSTATASATIPVPHDYQAVFTDPVAGDFHRVLQPGTYAVTCKATGYMDTTVTGVVVTADAKSICNCPMSKTGLKYNASSFTATCSGGGAGSGDTILDPGEDATLQMTLSNPGSVAATGVSATLATITPGITIAGNSAIFANVPGGGTGASVSPHFKFSVGTGVACGTVIAFTIHMTSAQGAWDDTLSVTVGQQAPGNPTTVFSESFDGATFPPMGWTVTDVSGTAANWARVTASTNPTGITPHTGAAMAELNSYHATNGTSERLARTANISVPAGSASAAAVLWVYHETGYSGYTDQIQVQTSPDGTTWTNRGTAINRYDGSTGWKQHTIDLTALISASNFRIGCLGISAYGNDTYLDDMSVTYTPPGACTMHACTPSTVPGETAPGDSAGTAQSWSADKATHSWPANAQATGYKVYRGVPADLPFLLNSTNDSCLKWSGAATTCSLGDTPASGSFYWYLILGTNTAGDGAAGSATAGARVLNASGSCP